MSDSLVFYVNRANDIHLIEPETLPHFEDFHPILPIAAAIIKAGYEGVAVDERCLSNGRWFQAVDVNLATPEGRLLQRLSSILDSGGLLPSPDAVVAAIRDHYEGTAGGDGAAVRGRD